MKIIDTGRPFLITALLCLSVAAQSECLPGEKHQSDNAPANMLGKFNIDKDLFLPQFDSKTDVDDLHSIAAVGTMLADPRFADVRFHAVAGAYGIQEGLYVPANQLFEMAFGHNWSDAHGNHAAALKTVSELVIETLDNCGDIWIAEAGQSDFSTAMVRQVKTQRADVDTRKRIHIVQHSQWNQDAANPADLAYVKSQTAYSKIEDGNASGNGTPGFKTSSNKLWRRATENTITGHLWKEARTVGNRFNGEEERYLNSDIKAGGMDFSDASESCWIFGFDGLYDAAAFFDEFD